MTYTLNKGGEKVADKKEGVNIDAEKIQSALPFVTLDEIKTALRCEDDKAREIMNNSDLQKFPVGREWRVRRDLWYEFIQNVYTFGLPQTQRGFKFATEVFYPTLEHGKNYDFLASLGFTDEQITEAYNNVQEKIRKANEHTTEDSN